MTVASDSSPGSVSKGKGKVKAWPPGFRFHPTDEELVLYYLKRKICRKRLQLDVIGETDVYKWDPEELPGLSFLQTGDRQWYFFTPRDRKYPNGARSNRATRQGYWKATGKDRNISCNSRNVGVKKTLVFYKGKAPSGERTDWVMHEYTLDEEELRRCLTFKEYYALYKVFKKSGPGPKNGEQYGAPFNEEEWAEDEYVDFNAIVADIEFPRKQVGEATPAEIVSIEGHAKLSCDSDNIDDMINEVVNNPAFNMPHVAENTYPLSQVGEEGTQCTALLQLTSDLIPGAPLQALYPVSQQCNVQPSDFIQSNSTQLPMHESSEITSASVIPQTYYPDSHQYDAKLCYEFDPNSCQLPLYETSEVTSATSVCEHKRQILGEGDFLEIDDLLRSDPIWSNEAESADGLRIEDLDGLGDFDLYYDAALNFEDMGSIDQDLLSYMNPFGDNNAVNHGFQMPQNPEVSYHMDNQLWSDSQKSAFHSAELIDGSLSQQTSGALCESGTFSNEGIVIDNSNSTERAGATSGFSSALWAFVESIPTNPASASEGKLVNLALGRMSSFTRLKNHVKPTVVTAGNDNSSTRQAPRKRASFIFFPVVVAFCALLWISIGAIRLL